jgi:hypothetical protein
MVGKMANAEQATMLPRTLKYFVVRFPIHLDFDFKLTSSGEQHRLPPALGG